VRDIAYDEQSIRNADDFQNGKLPLQRNSGLIPLFQHTVRQELRKKKNSVFRPIYLAVIHLYVQTAAHQLHVREDQCQGILVPCNVLPFRSIPRINYISISSKCFMIENASANLMRP